MEGPAPAPRHSCRGAPLQPSPGTAWPPTEMEPWERGNSFQSWAIQELHATIIRKLFLSLEHSTSHKCNTTRQHNGLCPLWGMLVILQISFSGGKGVLESASLTPAAGLKNTTTPCHRHRATCNFCMLSLHQIDGIYYFWEAYKLKNIWEWWLQIGISQDTPADKPNYLQAVALIISCQAGLPEVILLLRKARLREQGETWQCQNSTK